MSRDRRRAVAAAVAGAVVLVAAALLALRGRSRATEAPPVAGPAPSPVSAGTPSTAPRGAATVPLAWDDTARVIVEVLNASRVRGLGRSATAVLRDRGLDVVRTANAPDTAVRDTSLILLLGRRPDRADRVLRALGEGRIEVRPDPSRDVDVTVLLGRRWRPPPEPFHP